MRDIENEIKELESVCPLANSDEMFHALKSAIELIKVLKDEAESAWTLIEELKAAEIEAHSEVLKKELDRKITETLGLVRSKVVLA
jgi:hypothetical protein